MPKTPTPIPSQREGDQIFKPFLAAFAAKNGRKEGSPALGRGLGGGELSAFGQLPETKKWTA